MKYWTYLAILDTDLRLHNRDAIEALHAEGDNPLLTTHEVHSDERGAKDPDGHCRPLTGQPHHRYLVSKTVRAKAFFPS